MAMHKVYLGPVPRQKQGIEISQLLVAIWLRMYAMLVLRDCCDELGRKIPKDSTKFIGVMQQACLFELTDRRRRRCRSHGNDGELELWIAAFFPG